MKVGTDALLLATWASLDGACRILDAGTGCGIIALMAAQRAQQAVVVGVELEPEAVTQARNNAERSPFSDRVSIIASSIQSFASEPLNQGVFDSFLINPPFFHGKPKSPDPARNLARHDDALPLQDLVVSARKLLRERGQLQIVWPFDRWEELKEEAQRAGFQLVRFATVQGRPETEVTRVLSQWCSSGNADVEPEKEVICIEQGQRNDGPPRHTSRYKELLGDFVVDWPA
jgi:tRNA1Val (adenine37-N6)-methyltransferase